MKISLACSVWERNDFVVLGSDAHSTAACDALDANKSLVAISWRCTSSRGFY